MSEYLNRLKHLRDSKTPVGETAAVQTNISFRRAIDHIEKLEKELDVANEQRQADATILRCGIAAKYVMPVNNAPISLNDRLNNKIIDECIDVINKHYEAE